MSEHYTADAPELTRGPYVARRFGAFFVAMHERGRWIDLSDGSDIDEPDAFFGPLNLAEIGITCNATLDEIKGHFARMRRLDLLFAQGE